MELVFSSLLITNGDDDEQREVHNSDTWVYRVDAVVNACACHLFTQALLVFLSRELSSRLALVFVVFFVGIRYFNKSKSV